MTLAFLALGLAFALTCQALMRRTFRPEILDGHSDLLNGTVTDIAVPHGVLLAFLTGRVGRGSARRPTRRAAR